MRADAVPSPSWRDRPAPGKCILFLACSRASQAREKKSSGEKSDRWLTAARSGLRRVRARRGRQKNLLTTTFAFFSPSFHNHVDGSWVANSGNNLEKNVQARIGICSPSSVPTWPPYETLRSQPSFVAYAQLQNTPMPTRVEGTLGQSSGCPGLGSSCMYVRAPQNTLFLDCRHGHALGTYVLVVLQLLALMHTWACRHVRRMEPMPAQVCRAWRRGAKPAKIPSQGGGPPQHTELVQFMKQQDGRALLPVAKVCVVLMDAADLSGGVLALIVRDPRREPEGH